MNQPGPICNICTEKTRPTFHGFNGGAVPAHVWGSTASSGTCRRCPELVRPGELYVCHESNGQQDGIAHVTCPEPVLPPGGGSDD